MEDTLPKTGATAEAPENPSEKDGVRVYEVGYNVIPLAGEQGVSLETDFIRQFIESNQGTIIAEEVPQLINLAYPMHKDIDRKRHTTTTAYFGWVKFEAEPQAAHALKQALETRAHLVRFLVIKTTRDPFVKFQPPVTRQNGESPERHKAPRETEAAVAQAPMTVEAMDAEIDKLLVK